MKYALLLAVAIGAATWLAAAGGTAAPRRTGVQEPSRGTEEAIRLAVLTRLIRDTVNAKVVYIRVDGADPSPRVLAALRRLRPRVEPQSRTSAIPERKGELDGPILSVERIRWTGGGKVEARAGQAWGLLDARADDFYLVWKKGVWRIVRIKGHTVSLLPARQYRKPLSGAGDHTPPASYLGSCDDV